MPTYSRQEWLAGIQQIGSINRALQRNRQRKHAEFIITGDLDEDTRAYYENVGAIFERNIKEEIQDKAGEVISKLRDHPVDIVCRDELSARIIEAVCRVATQPQLKELLTLFKPHFTILMNHITTTFVVQALLTAVAAFVNLPDSILADTFNEIVQSHTGTWTETVFRSSAAFVCNIIFRILGNLPLEDTNEIKENTASPHPSFRSSLASIGKEFDAPKWAAKFRKFCMSTNAGRCIGALTIGMEKVDKKVYESLAKKLISDPKGRYVGNNLILKVVRWGKLLIPVIRSIRNPNVFSHYRGYLINHNFFRHLKKYPTSREMVMALLHTVPHSQFPVPEMIKTLKEVFEDLRKLTVFLKTDLVRVIFDIGAKVPELHTLIFDGFYETMCGNDALQYFSDLAFYSLSHTKQFSKYGTLVLKSLLQLQFQSKTLLLRSIYKSEAHLVARVACDKHGIFDTMFTPDVPDLISDKLVKLVGDLVPKMVLTLHGTIFVIHLFERASTKNKKIIVEKMDPIKNILDILPFSKPLIKRTKFSLYKTDPAKWKKKVKHVAAKKDFFTQDDLDTMLHKHKRFMDKRAREKNTQTVGEKKKKDNDTIMEDNKDNTKSTENSNSTNNNDTNNTDDTSNTDYNNMNDTDNTSNTHNTNEINDTHNTDNTTNSTDENTDTTNNGKKRKLVQNGGGKTQKRTRLDRLLDGEEAQFKLGGLKLGKYGKAREVKPNKIRKEKRRYQRRLKKQLLIEKNRIDKQRADAKIRSRERLRAKTTKNYPEPGSELPESKPKSELPEFEQMEYKYQV